MVDYGWIVNTQTDEVVWKMDLRETVHAGGAEKNRLANELLQLPAGHYQIHYETDDSHAYGSWNALPPLKEDHWGIALLPLDRDEATYASTETSVQPSRKVLAKLVGMKSDSYREQSFILKKKSKIQIFAIGEAADGEFHDQGWIEDNESGKKVWKMSYSRSEHAGGASKNRKIYQEIILPAGEYTVMYETDDSHAYQDWNDGAPETPESYGIQVLLIAALE